MKIAIISDIHDNLPNLDKVLEYIRQNNISKLICCGDFGSQETLAYLADNFIGQIWTVLGNMDKGHVEYSEVKDKFDNIMLFETMGKFSVDNKEVLIVHEPRNYVSYLRNDDFQYVFYGHTHRPWQEIIDGKMVLCPGNVANQLYAPTFAVWDTSDNKFELIQINLLK